MSYSSIPRPQFSTSEVRNAGKLLAKRIPQSHSNAPEITRAYYIFNNWRLSHAYPLLLCRNDLRKYLREEEIKADIPTRIKRGATIRRKLNGKNPLHLDKIQDLGGLRVILPDMDSVKRITERYLETNTRYIVKKENDYISSPRSSGYRSQHIILHHPEGIGIDRNKHMGQSIELQIRTKLQHIWATASEGLGFLLGVSFKHGEGDKKWHELFAAMSELLASEDGLSVRNKYDIAEEIRDINKDLDALPYLIKAKNSHLTLPDFAHDAWIVLNYDSDGDQPTSFREFNRLDKAQNTFKPWKVVCGLQTQYYWG